MRKGLAGLVCLLATVGLIGCGKEQFPPDDPLYDDQKNLEQIGIESAWEAGLTGKGVTIALIDSGVNIHDDLEEDRITGKSYVDEEEDDYSDSQGHGTFLAGMLAATRSNASGIAGMTDSDIRVYKVYETGSDIAADHVAQAVRDAADEDCDVINLSIGTPTDHEALREAVAYALDQGVIIVAAAGGDSETPYYPAAYDGVIGVDALSEELEPMETAADNESVDVTAPGEGLVSLDRTIGYERNGSGASYAAAHVTAMAAFARQEMPDLDSEGFLELLKESVQDLGEEDYDTLYGWGLVDCSLLVEALN